MSMIRSLLRYSGSPRLLLGVMVGVVSIFAATVSEASQPDVPRRVVVSSGVCFFVLPNGSGLVNLAAVGGVSVGRALQFSQSQVHFNSHAGTTIGRVELPEADAPKLLEAVQAAADKCHHIDD